MTRLLLLLAVIGCNDTRAPAPAPAHDEPPAIAAAVPPAIVRASLAMDADRACAIEASGKVACWGHTSPTPAEVPALADVAGLAAGPGATCAWTTRGAVACWGNDVRTAAAPALADVIQVSVGIDSACGLRAGGGVACWANGSRDAHDVAGLADVVEIAGAYGGGAEHLCARTKAGDVTCGNRVSPFAVIPELAGATSLGGAGARFAALVPGHRLASWVGWTGRPMPVLVDGVDGERVIVGGHLNGRAEICVLGARARCWDWSAEPLTLSELAPLGDGIRDVALDTEATCARIGDRVACSGRVGELGDGETEYPRDYAPVTGIADARQLEAAGRTLCALRGSGRVACWGERLRDTDDGAGARGGEIDRVPVELPGVTDAVEIAMEGADRGDGETHVAVAVCARRARGVTCWTSQRGELHAADAPELVDAAKLYSGPAVCGVAPSGAVRCVRVQQNTGSIPGFSEDDYEKLVYPDAPDVAARRVTRELEKRLHAALASKRPAVGFHGSGTSDPVGRTGAAFQPPADPRPDALERRRLAWAVDWDDERVRGALCARHGDGTIACWGERDYLGAGLHSMRADPVTVADVALEP